MIVFLAHRALSDLIEDGSHQRAFQTAYNSGQFSPEMLEITENIQAIHNSIECGIPENALKSGTVLVEANDFQDVEPQGDSTHEDLLASIGEMFASTSGESRLKEDVSSLNPEFSGKQLQGQQFIPQVSVEEETPLHSVIVEADVT